MANNNEILASADGYREVMDVASLIPRNAVLLGNNSRYLRAHNAFGNFLFKFDSQDSGSNMVRLEIIPVADYRVRIKSPYFNKYWRAHPDKGGYVHADADRGDEPGTSFMVFTIGAPEAKTYALKSEQCNLFLTRFSNSGAEDEFREVLRATDSGPVPNAVFHVYDANNFSGYTEETAAMAQLN